MKKNIVFSLFLSLTFYNTSLWSQTTDEDAVTIRRIYDKALTQGQSYTWLHYLTKNIGHRLSGSESAAQAVGWTKKMLDTLGADKVWLQPCQVPHWVRGEKEKAHFVKSKSKKNKALNILALGGSGAGEVNAEVIEVKSLDEVDKLGAAVKGKIVFFNRPMDPTQIATFAAYGGAVDQRVAGPARAAKYGAVAAIVRSMTTRLDDFPHTGTTSFGENGNPIPAVAVSTNHAELLSQTLKKEPQTKLYIKTNCKKLADETSYNVIAEFKGSEKPEEIIVVGGHLDSWDVGEGAHDDGTGCVQSMDVLNVLKRIGYKPKHTIRCVLFMNEENGLVGGRVYAAEAEKNKEKHICAIESDGGGHTPRGFSFESDESIFNPNFKKVSQWSELLEPYGLMLKKGGSGADISPLKKQKVFLCGFNADSQRYFDYHHTSNDTFEAVNQRELELGVAAMTSLVFLLDKYGLAE